MLATMHGQTCIVTFHIISAYHCKCIDPWLTKRKKTCPVCKRKVIPGSNPDSDSESSDEEGPTTSERTPLLAGNNNTPRRSTFDNSGKKKKFIVVMVLHVMKRKRKKHGQQLNI